MAIPRAGIAVTEAALHIDAVAEQFNNPDALAPACDPIGQDLVDFGIGRAAGFRQHDVGRAC